MSERVGWREWVKLPELGIKRLKCKVDTGAKNSALHTFDLSTFEHDGELWVRFSIHIDEHDLSKIQTCEAKVQDIRDVTDSGGNVTNRYFIETLIEIGEHKIMAPVSLTSRDTMAFKMLLGRTALRQAGLVVHPAKSYLQGKK
ncbi:ribosomal protein S6 modification protein [Thiomicrorhabdus immobilis]|uniref:Ribosomal protein S6 modification protein n=1 Tax=Thiomicrorhabdus immobilis TaxID=2791037 RepID=A0ABN6CUE5_9GAMM|nr:RimK/LysX family protein [Thiomicrorhabdus immobilis]BCN92605.1 ribosomal protein S6 modification protein [Thiomicrorhabdus immobilis]